MMYKINENINDVPLTALTCCVNARHLSRVKKIVAVNRSSQSWVWMLGLHCEQAMIFTSADAALPSLTISVVEDEGLELLLRAATGDPTYTLPARRTIVRRIHDKYAAEKAVKDEKLAAATYVALTGDHWTYDTVFPPHRLYLGGRGETVCQVNRTVK